MSACKTCLLFSETPSNPYLRILDVERFAEVTFVPKSYQGTIAASGDSKIQVNGVFTLHGTPHDLTVPLDIHIDGATLTAKTHFQVPYVQWGLKNPSFLIWKADDDVAIFYTSGTTGKPKGAVISHRNVISIEALSRAASAGYSVHSSNAMMMSAPSPI